MYPWCLFAYGFSLLCCYIPILEVARGNPQRHVVLKENYQFWVFLVNSWTGDVQDHEGSVMAQKWRPCQVWTDVFIGASLRSGSLVIFLCSHLNVVFLITSHRKLSTVFPQLVEAKALSLAPHSQLWRCLHVPCSLQDEQRLPVQFAPLGSFLFILAFCSISFLSYQLS